MTGLIRFFFLAALAALPFNFVSCSSNSETDSEPDLILERRIDLGYAYASSTINVSVFRQSAVLTVPDGRLVGFYDKDGRVKVVLLTRDGDIWNVVTVRPQLSDSLLGDGHCVISIGYSKNGMVHVMYGAHATQPYYAAFPLSILKTGPYREIEIDAVSWTEDITYPQFYNIDDTLYLLYRRDNTGQVVILSYEPNTPDWLLAGTGYLLEPGSYVSVYINRLAVRGKQVALSWMYRLPLTDDGLVVNEGIYLLLSDDASATWKDLQMRPYSLPQQQWNVPKFFNLPLEAGLINQNSSAIGPDGKIYLLHLNKDSQMIPQIFLSIIDPAKGSFCTKAVSKNTVAFHLKGRGTLLLPLSRADVAVSDRMVHVMYRQGDELVIASTDRNNLCDNEWRYSKLDTPPLGGWEPNYDLQAWENEGRLILYIQAARQGLNDTAIDGPPSRAFLYELREY